VDVVANIRAASRLESDELWFKDAIIYQLHVKAFADSNNDGIGDFAGLTEKLDYLEDLGVTALWLLPFYPSPGRDDGYDISDYRTINADFGTMSDFRRFMQEANLCRNARHPQRHREIKLGVGLACWGVLLAPLLFAPAGSPHRLPLIS
jgi:Alpha amylase, catalytic domain